MNILESISNLAGRKSAKDLTKAVSDLVADEERAQARRAELQAQLRSAPFDAPDTVPELRDELRAIDDELALLTGVIEEATTRAQSAVASEDREVVVRRMDAVRKDREKLCKTWRAFDQLVGDLEVLAAEIGRGHESIRVANDQARHQGYDDLVVRTPAFSPAGISGAAANLRQMSMTSSLDTLKSRGL